MKLNALFGESRFIVGPQQVDSPLYLPPLEFGNVRPVELRAWEKSASGALYAVDLSSYEITLLVGPPNVRPSLGFWQLTTTEGTSPHIASRASNEDVAEALGYAFGQCTVEGGNGSYIVTVDAVGAWTLPTATFQGNTLSSVLVFEITPGTTETPAQYRIEVLEVAPARIIPAEWSAGDTTPVSTFTQTSGRLWSLVLSEFADNGFFTLTVDGITTGFINLADGAYGIAVQLAAAGKPADVVPNNEGGYWVNFMQTTTTASVGGNLVILPFQEGSIDLTGSGVRELLDGEQYAPAKLAIVLEKDGQTETLASADIMLTMPVNQPATITIDSPQMAGISFAISADGAYMHVYLNGDLLYDIPVTAVPKGIFVNVLVAPLMLLFVSV